MDKFDEYLIRHNYSDKEKERILPTTVTGNAVITHKVILCDRCKGLGFFEREELGDYHRRDYYTVRSDCQKCEGDGRLIVVNQHVHFHKHEQTQEYAYASWKEIVDPHFSADKYRRWRIDNRDRQMEAKYPELAALSYDKYDDLLEKYRLIEALKKEEVNES